MSAFQICKTSYLIVSFLYRYWYLNGVLFPDIISVQIAIDKMDAENGALQVLRGSHRMGRIEHGRVGQQAGADIERVKEVRYKRDVFYGTYITLKLSY